MIWVTPSNHTGPSCRDSFGLVVVRARRSSIHSCRLAGRFGAPAFEAESQPMRDGSTMTIRRSARLCRPMWDVEPGMDDQRRSLIPQKMITEFGLTFSPFFPEMWLHKSSGHDHLFLSCPNGDTSDGSSDPFRVVAVFDICPVKLSHFRTHRR